MKQYNPEEIENEIREFWKRINLADKLRNLRKGKKKFYLLDGPPYVNAMPHVGHIKTTTCKDVWSKFKLMQGYDSWFQAGFDCHGLPVEVMVEKELGIEKKSDIERMGIEKFMKMCLKKVLNNEEVWMNSYNLLGAWRGLYKPYFTYKNYYIESGWWTIKVLHETGFLFEGEKPIHWCPHCETALSGYEVSDSYKNLTDPSIYVKFKAKDSDEFFIVWTTTPWTLIGNVAIAVHPRENYVKIKVGKEKYILAEKRLKEVAELVGFRYEVLEKIKGSELDGIKYEAVLDVPQQNEIKERRVILSIPIMKHKKYKKHKINEADKQTSSDEFEEFVSMDEGSGIVHVAPGHGSTDHLIGNHYKLSSPSPVDEQGRFTEKAGKFKGMFVKDAEELIIEELRNKNRLLFSTKITHPYPVCWRCKTPLLFRSSRQWYLSIEPIKRRMLSSNEKVKWMPAFGRKRFRNWLSESDDWCISQQRYWGIPMPIWRCSCGKIEVIGSVKELKEKSKNEVSLDDLHRHTVDKVKLKCSCGKEMKRIPDIFNVWYDSGIAPWASLGYPFKNKELFESMFPCDLIVESQDQIRGWFYSLMFTSMAVFGKAPYRAVGMMGWVVDEKGEKMSKSLGNVVWAEDALKNLGGDVVRLYYCWEVAPWELQKFSFRTCEEVKRSLNILWNIYGFFKEYCTKEKEMNNLKIEDRWILSRINSLNREVVKHFEEFNFHLVGRTLMRFVLEDLSRFYIKLVRDRVWVTASEDEKKTVSAVLYYVLDRIVKMFAPIIPFITEYIYQDLKGDKSVHMCNWPAVDKHLINEELEREMEIVKKIVEAANAIRQKEKLKLKYILPSLSVSGSEEVLKTVKHLNEIIARTVNVKKVEIGEEVGYELKLNYSVAGKKFGRDIKVLEHELEKLEAKTVKERIETTGKFEIKGFVLEKDDLVFVQKPLKHGRSFNGGVVVLNTEADEKLKQEWLLRELIRAVQSKRKEMGLKVTESITLCLPKEFKAFEKQISLETGSRIVFTEPKGEKEEFEFEGEKYWFGVEK